MIKVSVVMPVYNEKGYIKQCIESLLQQDYPLQNMEWIFVDGGSTDCTKSIINKYSECYPTLIKILDNPRKIVPCAMNIGIAETRGEYVIRLDAHADYPKDYISRCVYWLEKTDACNVGGIAQTKAKGRIGNAIAKMLSSKFGVGNSQFRIHGRSGYVDTVPFGAFRRAVFRTIGGYDERLVRNQDNELNYRIRKMGGKIYLSSDICFSYYCRDNLTGIVEMSYKNGMWNVVTMYLCPGSMGLRHFVPFMFVMSIIALCILSYVSHFFITFLVLELATYFLISIITAAKLGKNLCEILLLILLFPMFHISYGVGSIFGLCNLLKKKYRVNYKPKLI